ncbi:hypothetical protein CALCODRAFT_137034 [Calocera cornea HHB12733]|uniref:Uncharacterized protein n=1 Tax=Calocera cornea HHB12733 TaxID=1353952 RepID=A0A165CTS6_9BASI|nr:hypothetical protein CALCODRAFT_137034 [Calocera cornea HHB12733]
MQLVIRDKLDARVREHAQERRAVALEQPAHARALNNIPRGVDDAGERACMRWRWSAGVQGCGPGRKGAPAYFWNSLLLVWNRILTLSSGATAVFACACVSPCCNSRKPRKGAYDTASEPAREPRAHDVVPAGRVRPGARPAVGENGAQPGGGGERLGGGCYWGCRCIACWGWGGRGCGGL